jgi:hypothetical protein
MPTAMVRAQTVTGTECEESQITPGRIVAAEREPAEE